MHYSDTVPDHEIHDQRQNRATDCKISMEAFITQDEMSISTGKHRQEPVPPKLIAYFVRRS